MKPWSSQNNSSAEFSQLVNGLDSLAVIFRKVDQRSGSFMPWQQRLPPRPPRPETSSRLLPCNQGDDPGVSWALRTWNFWHSLHFVSWRLIGIRQPTGLRECL